MGKRNNGEASGGTAQWMWQASSDSLTRGKEEAARISMVLQRRSVALQLDAR
jgi:hypothetical protein